MPNGLRNFCALFVCLASSFLLGSSTALQAQPQTPPTAPVTPVASTDTPAPGAQSSAPASSSAELSTSDSSAILKVRVNLVVVRAVVRDADGHVIDNLKKEDFQLFDNGKLQLISSLTVEHAGQRIIPNSSSTPTTNLDTTEPTSAAPEVTLPSRFVALVFDDLHLRLEDAVTVRAAANKVLDRATANDAMAIYTTSGVVTQDFTKDLPLLRNTLLRVVPHPLQGGTGINECPSISYFQAERMLTYHDTDATTTANQDAWTCAYNQHPKEYAEAVQLAHSTAQQVQNQGDGETNQMFQNLAQFIRRLSAMPGQRVLAFISPGIASNEAYRRLNETIDQAVKANVVVDTLDARGLYTPDFGDISAPSSGGVGSSGSNARFRLLEQSMAGEILGSLAHGTGGTWFHNRNDLDRGISEIIATPPASYVITFSPQNLKNNGGYHTLKLKLVNGHGLEVQARHGYFAPKNAPDPAVQAQAEIEDALVSQEELNEFPVELKTQFFMKDSNEATVTVLAHLDLKALKFRKNEGRNYNDITVATAIFDQNGNYVKGSEKTLKVKMLDATLATHNSGVTIRSSFDLKPGTYLIRLVGRDTEGPLMTARNGALTIPN
jgi:VWFA-related protein